MFIDTSFCIDMMRERNKGQEGPATKKLAALDTVPLYMSVFVACELQAGARLSNHAGKELRKVEILTELVEVVLPDRAFAVSYGEAEAFLRKKGKSIPVMDLLIGVTAKMYGMALLTNDDAHFKRIPDLVIETY